MRNLLQLLIRFGGLIVFLLLEGICFLLIVTYNQTQNQIFFSSANAAVGAVYEGFAAARDYFSLGNQNDQLLRANQRLMAENERLHRVLEQHTQATRDSVLRGVLSSRDSINGDTLPAARFTYVGAKVINNSIAVNNNMITLDKGSRDGVKSNCGVINGRGIVGIVRAVSDNYSAVMSILHRQTRISAAIKGKAYFGTLTWRDLNPRFMNLEAVPKHASLAIKDTVVTSGYSHLFPPGIVVGVIDTLWLEPGDNFHTIRVELINDISRLEYAYVTIKEDRTELRDLERKGGQ